MKLVENVHYGKAILSNGWTLAVDCRILHCTDTYDGKVVLLWRCHPDITDEDVKELGKKFRQERLASRPKRRSVARSRPKK